MSSYTGNFPNSNLFNGRGSSYTPIPNREVL
jgi:hypothetical protein